MKIEKGPCFKKISIDLLKLIRGKRSQQQMNDRLGHSFNQSYRWEKGITKISWPGFVEYCSAAGKPLLPTLAPIFTNIKSNKALKDTGKLLKLWLGAMSIENFSKRYAFPRKAVSKWLSGESSPTLEQMLLILHYHMGHLIKFCDLLGEAEKISELAPLIKNHQIRESITFKYPQVSFILNYMHTSPFKHIAVYERGHFAQIFGLELEQEDEIIKALLASGTIETANKSYRMSQYDVFRITGTPQDLKRRYGHYLKTQSKIVENRNVFGTGSDYLYHMVFPSNPEKFQKVAEILRNASREISQYIGDDQTQDDNQAAWLLTCVALQLDIDGHD